MKEREARHCIRFSSYSKICACVETSAGSWITLFLFPIDVFVAVNDYITHYFLCESLQEKKIFSDLNSCSFPVQQIALNF